MLSYIFHMPVFNFWLFMAWPLGPWTMLLCIGAIFALAGLSWIAVERPALRMKRSTLFQR